MGRYRKRVAAARRTGVLVALLAAHGCDSTGPGGALLRFGSVGEVRVTVDVPLQGGMGWRQQVLTWNSDGAWTFYEEIGYEGVVGDRSLVRNPGLPVRFAGNYPSLIQLVNDDPSTKLFGLPDSLFDSGLDPNCGEGRSRVTLGIHDDGRDERESWTRCAGDASPLATLRTRGSGPDPQGSRVVQLAILARDFTLGEDFRGYAYTGSWPFATLDKGTESPTRLVEPRVYRSPYKGGSDGVAEQWTAFWNAHADTASHPVPDVAWQTEMVVVAAVGERQEVGDSVEVRRILQIGDAARVTGTRIEIVERIPGDYCAPARRVVHPYHIVVTPRVPDPVVFVVSSERVPCGIS